MTLPTQGTVPYDAAMAAHWAQGHYTDGSNKPFPSDAGYQWASASSGNDANDGLAPQKCKATLQAAYDALPSTGGTVFMMRSTFNVDGYTNGHLTLSATKPCVFTTLSGTRALFAPYNGTLWDGPMIVGTGPALVLIDTGFQIGSGMAFHGIHFDMRNTAVLAGILVRDMNYLVVKDCSFEGGNQAGFAIRSQEVQSGWADTMEYRIEDNYCRSISLYKGLDSTVFFGVTPNYPPGGNQNHIEIQRNTIFGNPGYAIDAYNLQRSTLTNNNIEGGTSGIILRGAAHKNAILWQGGEGTPSPYLTFDNPDINADAGAYGNYYQNFATDGGTAVSDLAMISVFGGANYPIATKNSAFSVKTASYNLPTGHWYEITIFMQAASPLGLFIDRWQNAGIPVGASFRVVQSGAGVVTVTKHANVTIVGPLVTTGLGSSIRFIKTAAPDTWYSHFG